jgi:hypothetical protein
MGTNQGKTMHALSLYGIGPVVAPGDMPLASQGDGLGDEEDWHAACIDVLQSRTSRGLS